jgi:methyl-accepting chemotaxis protein
MRKILTFSLTAIFTLGLLSGYCQDAAQDAIRDIKAKNERIDDYLEDINHSYEKNAYDDIARYSRDIKYLCKDIADLAENLSDYRRREITKAVGKVEDYANDLTDSAKQGHIKHDQMHDDFEHLEKECERFRIQVMLLN